MEDNENIVMKIQKGKIQLGDYIDFLCELNIIKSPFDYIFRRTFEIIPNEAFSLLDLPGTINKIENNNVFPF